MNYRDIDYMLDEAFNFFYEGAWTKLNIKGTQRPQDLKKVDALPPAVPPMCIDYQTCTLGIKASFWSEDEDVALAVDKSCSYA
ncbi:hypothetical protein E2542_SST04769 [Spatholobus suberectus]|nr:hypothetical protein E2542_SST04769 [Spatholobus suberectus]